MYRPEVYAKEMDNLKWYSTDLDGFLAEEIWPTKGIGEPIPENIKKVEDLHAKGYKIVIHTSRAWADYENIERWLDDHGVPFKAIVCGKLLAHRYLDDKNEV